MTKIIGITGGIGSGKTTFSNHLKKLGYLVHESDVIVSEIYTNPKKQFLIFIKEKISQDAVNHNKINKAEIANVIFSNKKIKKLLERRIHKEVQIARDVFIKKNTIISDIVYQPKETPFLKEFKLNKKIYGISMLVEQALPCFKQWFGFFPVVEDALIKKLHKKIK